MSRIAEYRERLRDLPVDQWEAYLLAESRLPGPRGNLELANAVADLAGEPGVLDRLQHWAAIDADCAPTNTPGEFLAFCGVLGKGEAAARVVAGNGEGGFVADAGPLMAELRTHAADPRWRVREAVAQAFQRVGDRDLAELRAQAELLADSGWLDRRAAVAAVCEPRLLKDPDHAAWVVDLLDRITRSLAERDDADPDRRVLRQALGYGWSVAIVAGPEVGRAAFERWADHPHPDARWIVRENLKKNRLRKLDADWVAALS
jgi:hypothetical protein